MADYLGMTTNGTIEEISRLVREARKKQGMTQMYLAKEVGCMQSAISMLEMGKPTAVSVDNLEKIASILKIELPKAQEQESILPAFMPAIGRCCCPNFQCPSNMPYIVGSEVFFMPLGLAGSGKYCRVCGEVLISSCQQCGAPIGTEPGACCKECGARFAEAPSPFPEPDIQKWIQNQRMVIDMLREIYH